MADPVLETREVTRTFGAVIAVDSVSVGFEPGRIHAVIGPNGAGKTTLINLLSGELRPSGGRIMLRGRDITGVPAHRVARLGVGRSYQRTNVFPGFTCLQNCWLGAWSRLATSMRFIRPADRYAEVARWANEGLTVAGLGDRRDCAAGRLSHGERRQLEIGMMLAAGPQVLLLDEPLAGMGANEADRLLDLLVSLKGERTIVLVEHDMDAVFAVADRITVMVGGRELATGGADEIRANPAVSEVYLGHGEDAG